MPQTSLTADSWQLLDDLRGCSRLILAALEADDISEVERLSRDSAVYLDKIKPLVERRLAAPDRTEEDRLLAETLKDLQTMTDRIIEEIEARGERISSELGALRQNRIKLSHYRSDPQKAPAFLNRTR